MMRAITLWPEWAWAICRLNKRVENRGYRPPAAMVGELVAIHAGKYFGGRAGRVATVEALHAIEDTACEAGWEVDVTLSRERVFLNGDQDVRWGIRGSTLLERGDDRYLPLHRVNDAYTPIATSAIVAVARIGFLIEPTPDPTHPWHAPDSWGWLLEDVRVLDEPILCKGKQGLWFPPADVAARLP